MQEEDVIEHANVKCVSLHYYSSCWASSVTLRELHNSVSDTNVHVALNAIHNVPYYVVNKDQSKRMRSGYFEMQRLHISWFSILSNQSTW